MRTRTPILKQLIKVTYRSSFLRNRTTMSIPLYLLTYNCGKLKINATEFIDKISSEIPDEICDLYVFGFQELCSILDGGFKDIVNKHLIDINRIVLDTLKRKFSSHRGDYNFTTVGFHHIGAIGMIAVSPFALRFRDCRYADVSCGNGNSLLKGGVGFRMKYSSDMREFVELTIASAHLCAYQGEFYYLRRIENIQTIMRALDFGDGYSFLKPKSHTIFMGDLNFRTTKSLKLGQPNAAFTDLIELHDHTDSSATEKEIEDLVLKHDELTRGKINGELFTGFEEGCITFQPTYKYYPNTAIYNSKRCPLWCDRVLYQNTYRSGLHPEIHNYKSIPSYMRSDHRPVYLHISLPLEPPESIIGANGYLMILPSAGPSRHVYHARSYTNEFPDTQDAVSGPTQIYMKCTVLDKVTQLLSRRVSDFCIGYGLWLGTTPRGRLILLLVSLSLWLLYSMLR